MVEPALELAAQDIEMSSFLPGPWNQKDTPAKVVRLERLLELLMACGSLLCAHLRILRPFHYRSPVQIQS